MLNHEGHSKRINRRNFLQGRFSVKRSTAIRPPWSVEESVFLERCTQCNQCVAQCETGVLVSGDGGYPEVDFSRGECTFCEACAKNCQPQALSLQITPPWTFHAGISGNCLTRSGVVCMTCRDQCPEQAISMQPTVGQPDTPMIDDRLCTGCGACFAPCPTQAIQMIRSDIP